MDIQFIPGGISRGIDRHHEIAAVIFKAMPGIIDNRAVGLRGLGGKSPGRAVQLRNVRVAHIDDFETGFREGGADMIDIIDRIRQGGPVEVIIGADADEQRDTALALWRHALRLCGLIKAEQADESEAAEQEFSHGSVYHRKPSVQRPIAEYQRVCKPGSVHPRRHEASAG